MLGELLKRMRKQRGLKVRHVIEALGVPRSTAYFWETPAGRPDPASLGKLLDLYGATPEERLQAWQLRASDPEAGEPA